jgi:hypothetical protein
MQSLPAIEQWPFTPVVVKRRPISGLFTYVFGWASVVLGTISIFAILLSFESEVSWLSNVVVRWFYYVFWILALVNAPFSIRFINRGRRLLEKDALALLQQDKRPPVLLLRSFEDDTLYDPSIRPVSFRLRFARSRYEESLDRALRSLGPVITIGRPGEQLPQAGAARLYVNDQQWTQAVDFFLECSSAAVIIVGRSEGVWWEIETVLRHTQKEKIIFFFPYVEGKSTRESLIRTFYLFMRAKTYTRKRLPEMEEERQQRYVLFRQRVEKILPETSFPETLGSAQFLVFDQYNNLNLLTSVWPRTWYFGRPFVERLQG